MNSNLQPLASTDRKKGQDLKGVLAGSYQKFQLITILHLHITNDLGVFCP